MKKQVSLALVSALLAGSVPAWAETATTRPDGSHALRGSVDHAVAQVIGGDRIPVVQAVADESGAGPALTDAERRDLERRHASLKKDPVARGGGSAVMILVGTALSIGASVYLIHELNKNNNNTQATAH
ncbi:MAG TPA: hypothetical protein VEQ10_22465 [Vicinamibacteria bacterium]|nr:hypothetical protein [Vicinamibacteria bacterium]